MNIAGPVHSDCPIQKIRSRLGIGDHDQGGTATTPACIMLSPNSTVLIERVANVAPDQDAALARFDLEIQAAAREHHLQVLVALHQLGARVPQSQQAANSVEILIREPAMGGPDPQLLRGIQRGLPDEFLCCIMIITLRYSSAHTHDAMLSGGHCHVG
jgi:hypothetical protein